MLQNRWSSRIVLCSERGHVDKRCCVSAQAAEVEIEDVSRAYTLFIDVKRSTEFLVAHESDYMFNQVRQVWLPAPACVKSMLTTLRVSTLSAA